MDMLSLYDKAMSHEDILSAGSSVSMAQELHTHDKRYGSITLVGQGGMKEVYRVKDRLTRRFVAMALLRKNDDPNQQERFLREARLTAALEHPNIMPIYDIGFNDQNRPFFTMKYTGDQNLYRLLKTAFPAKSSEPMADWPLFERLNLFVNICEGIAFAHSRHILHLDLKPRNILVGEFGEVLICDWGLGKVLFEDDTDEETLPPNIDPIFFHEVSLQGSVKGTPGYMAPEQIDKNKGIRDQRTDTYALGGILFALLTGHAPVAGRTTQEVFDHTIAGQIDWANLKRHRVPAALTAVLRKALDRNPEHRYSSAALLKQDILSFIGGYATLAENAGFFRNLVLLTKRYKIATALTTVLILLSLLFTKHLYTSEKEARTLLGMYQEAKQFHTEFREETIEELLTKARNTQNDHAFVKSIIHAQQILALDPESEEGWSLLGQNRFYLQEFNAAAKALIHATPETQLQLYHLAKEAGRKKPDNQRLESTDVFRLLKSLNTNHARHLFSKERLNYTDLASHMHLVHHMLRATNPDIENLNFKYELSQQTLRIDLSNNPNLSDLFAIKGLPISELNLESTATPQGAMRYIEGTLKKLNIAGTDVRRFDFVDQLPELEEIIVSEERYSKNKLRSLRQKVRIVETASQDPSH
jgi:serine/threonine protein kinase